MKYIRSFVTMLIAIVLFAAVVIGLGVIFAVKNVNVDMLVYSEDCSDDYAALKEALSPLKGKSILLIDESDIAPAVEECGYSLDSCKKKYPCTLNLTVLQRMELFAAETDTGYDMYDGDGNYLRSSEENVNSVDLAPNILLENVKGDDLQTVVQLAGKFGDVFGALRSMVSTVVLDTNDGISDVYVTALTFKMHSGVEIVIYDYENYAEEKIGAAYDCYCSLSESRKLKGRILCYRLDGDEGEITASYDGGSNR